MPSYKSHLLLGFIIALSGLLSLSWVIPKIDPATCLMIIAFTLCGALFPDIDTVSRVGRIAELVLPAGALFAFCSHRSFEAGALLLFLLFIKIIPHRTITHRYSFIIFFSGLLCAYFCSRYPEYNFFCLIASIFFLAGALSHLWIDKKVTLFKRRLRRR